MSRQGDSSVLGLEINPANLTEDRVASDADLGAEEIEEFHPNGNLIMVASGQYRDKLVNDKGTPRLIQEPVMVPMMVPIGKAKVDELKLQRNQSLDRLEKLAVKEASEGD